MPSINLKQQVMFTTIGIALISVAIVGIVIVPSVKQILSLKQNITETQKFMEEQYQKTQRVRQSVHSLDETFEQTKKFNDITINEGDELKVITELEKLAANNSIDQNLKVQKIDPKETKDALSEEEKKTPSILRKRPYYTFSFSNTGYFEHLVDYLKEMERMPYYLNITSLQFDKKNNSDLLGLQFDANVYITEKNK